MRRAAMREAKGRSMVMRRLGQWPDFGGHELPDGGVQQEFEYSDGCANARVKLLLSIVVGVGVDG
jgi:hypothetical protein